MSNACSNDYETMYLRWALDCLNGALWWEQVAGWEGAQRWDKRYWRRQQQLSLSAAAVQRERAEKWFAMHAILRVNAGGTDDETEIRA